MSNGATIPGCKDETGRRDIADCCANRLNEVAIGVLLVGAAQVLLGIWIKGRLEGAVKEYDKRLNDYEAMIKVREQASKVAELLAIAFDPTTEPKLAWELSLWLSASLVCNLSRCLAGTGDAKSPKDILIEVRQILLYDRDAALRPENILHRERRFTHCSIDEGSDREEHDQVNKASGRNLVRFTGVTQPHTTCLERGCGSPLCSSDLHLCSNVPVTDEFEWGGAVLSSMA